MEGQQRLGCNFVAREKSFWYLACWWMPPKIHYWIFYARDHTRTVSVEDIAGLGRKPTLIFFFLHSSQAFMIRIMWACSRCSLVFVPRPAELVTSTPSLVMIENPGSLNSATFFVSFFTGFLETRDRPGGVMLKDPFLDSPKVAEELGEGV